MAVELGGAEGAVQIIQNIFFMAVHKEFVSCDVGVSNVGNVGLLDGVGK